ncbi:hypothetical protein ASF65_14015 [Aureimonas sp. Leaf324]|nr:hypothetical protein ASF65_14015 [Aureimonas sp. Leaf324]
MDVCPAILLDEMRSCGRIGAETFDLCFALSGLTLSLEKRVAVFQTTRYARNEGCCYHLFACEFTGEISDMAGSIADLAPLD